MTAADDDERTTFEARSDDWLKIAPRLQAMELIPPSRVDSRMVRGSGAMAT